MKLLVVTSEGYQAGGAETILVRITPYLINKGYTVKTLASELGADKEHFNDYTFRSVSSTGIAKIFFFLFNPFSFFALKRVLKKYEPDVVHLHVMHEMTPSILFLLKNYPTVITLHGPETFISKLLIWQLKPENFKHHVYDKKDLNIFGRFIYFYYNRVQKFVYKLALRNVDMFIAPSKHIQEAARDDTSPSPIVLIPNFIELRKFHEFKNNYNLLFVGRLEKFKGVEFLIQAMAIIIKVFPQATLTIVGNGSYKANLVSLTKKLQLERYIQFKGWIDNKNLDIYYERASCVIVSSICAEAFGLVILEAMSAGRPVIGTKVGGIPEIIDDGVNGFLVEPYSPEQIADRVLKLFEQENSLPELGRNAREKAEEFNIEKYVEKLEKVYEEVKGGGQRDAGR